MGNPSYKGLVCPVALGVQGGHRRSPPCSRESAGQIAGPHRKAGAGCADLEARGAESPGRMPSRLFADGDHSGCCSTSSVARSVGNRRPRFLEVFSGEGTLAGVAASMGFGVSVVDIRHGPEHDLLTPANQLRLLEEVKTGKYALASLGHTVHRVLSVLRHVQSTLLSNQRAPLGARIL